MYRFSMMAHNLRFIGWITTGFFIWSIITLNMQRLSWKDVLSSQNCSDFLNQAEPSTNGMRAAVVVTTVCNPTDLQNDLFSAYAHAASKSNCTFVVLSDMTTCAYNAASLNYTRTWRTIEYTFDQLSVAVPALSATSHSNPLWAAHTPALTLLLKEQCNAYWIVEADALFHGNMFEFFARVDSQADLLMQYKISEPSMVNIGQLHYFASSWPHGTLRPLDTAVTYKGKEHVFRISRRLLGHFDNLHRVGVLQWSEFFVPTVCELSHYTCEQLDGNITGKPFSWEQNKAVSQSQWPSLQDNLWYHPVKWTTWGQTEEHGNATAASSLRALILGHYA